MSKYIGIEWVVNYRNRYPYLANSGRNAKRFLYALTQSVVPPPPHFEHGDTTAIMARGRHFERDLTTTLTIAGVIPDGPEAPFGEADAFAETVDILYFSGHGHYHHLIFSNTALMDDEEARHTELQLGRLGKLKWLIADACKVLNNVGVIRRWGIAFHGLRYLLGFDGDCRDESNRGRYFANQLKLNDTIQHAWELACLENEDGSVPWAYLHAGGPRTPIENDRWTMEVFVAPTEDPPVFTYVRNEAPDT